MWWVITSIDMIPEVDALLVYAYTSQDDHLFMSWSYYKPSRTPVYRVVRGTEKLCGYKYIWDTPNLVEQIEFGDTPDHMFYLIDLTPGRTIWFYLWAPDGPYGLEIQGPLMHVSLPSIVPPWVSEAYVATKAKGIFKTQNFSGPGEAQPTWVPDNAGLDSLNIRQACPDPFMYRFRRYLLAGDDVYSMLSAGPDYPATSTKILTRAQALALTMSVSGTIWWIATNAKSPGYLYALFNSALGTNGTWSLRTFNYGETWAAHQIYAGWTNYDVGNIMADISQPAKIYDTSRVLYAALNAGAAGNFRVYMSANNGLNWALMDEKGFSIAKSRVLVDPTIESTVYTGAFLGWANPRELFRSTEYGANLAQVDGAHHLGIFLGLPQGVMWIDSPNNFHAKVLQQNRIWTTIDYCVSWSNPGLTAVPVWRMAIRKGQTDKIYLARQISAPVFPDAGGKHVIFISADDGITMYGKSGDHPDQDDGGGDSIPWNCGGIAQEGIMPIS